MVTVISTKQGSAINTTEANSVTSTTVKPVDGRVYGIALLALGVAVVLIVAVLAVVIALRMKCMKMLKENTPAQTDSSSRWYN